MKEKTTKHYSSEIREPAIRMVREHQDEYPSEWAAIHSISSKFGCTAETLRRWLRLSQTATVTQKAPTSNESERIKALERENRKLRQTNEILRKASAYLHRRSSTTHRAQAPVQTMKAFIDDYRGVYGVEPICKVLPIAPSTYYRHAARHANPELRSNRAK